MTTVSGLLGSLWIVGGGAGFGGLGRGGRKSVQRRGETDNSASKAAPPIKVRVQVVIGELLHATVRPGQFAHARFTGCWAGLCRSN